MTTLLDHAARVEAISRKPYEDLTVLGDTIRLATVKQTAHPRVGISRRQMTTLYTEGQELVRWDEPREFCFLGERPMIYGHEVIYVNG